MTTASATTGRRYEALAQAYLEQRGLITHQTRYRCRFGELDLVCQQAGVLVIVEVKARRHNAQVGAALSVDRFKMRRIIACTRHFLMTHPHWHERPLRFDVVAISSIDADPQIQWITNAFEAD